jgi:micrococcal nuclease
MSHAAEPMLGAVKFIIILIVIGVIVDFLPADIKSLPDLQIGGNKTLNNNISISKDTYKVLKVVDGDTLDIDYDGVVERVRLIGINTPESVDPRRPVECYGKEASDYAKDILEGEQVKIEFDNSQQRRDQYDRLLAYVYLDDGQMVNRKMIADGYAYEYTYNTPYKYQSEFKSLQAIAKNLNRGLWAEDTCDGVK